MHNKGISITGVLVSLAVLVIGVAWMVGSGGGKTEQVFPGELYTVIEGSFEVSVPSSGELASKNQINIYNHLESGATIIELVEEGSRVTQGDVLLRLNDEKIKDDIRNSEINVDTGNNDLRNAQKEYSVMEKKRDSVLAQKQLAIDLGALALQSWQEGEVVAKRQDLALAVQTADKNYQRLFKKFESSTLLFEQKFLSRDELDQDEISLLNADATLKKANLDVVVYENYTHLQQKQVKESDLQQAKDDYEQESVLYLLDLNNAQSNIEAKENKLASHVELLEKRRGQLEKCIVVAPASGMVVYASSMGRNRDDGEPLDVGQNLHRNQMVMTIPDTSNMIARVKVNEALSGLITGGQRATVTCDALPDFVFEGEVLSVGVLAEGGGWRDPNRRDYTVELKIIDLQGAPLKPSMRCSAEIFVENINDVLFVPIHSIHRSGGTIWVWKQAGGGYKQHEITIGSFSDSYAEIVGGLESQDVVLLREPSPSMVVGRLMDEETEE